MRFSGIVVSANEVFADHSWYSDGLALICAQSVCDAKLVADLMDPKGEWRVLRHRVGLFYNYGSADTLAAHTAA